MKLALLFVSVSILSFSGCATLSEFSAEPERRRQNREELERTVRSLREENARLNRELQGARLESERIRSRGDSLTGELAESRAREKELQERLASREETQKDLEARLSATEKRLSEIISGREAGREEIEKIADDFLRSLRGLGLFSVERGPGEVRVVLPTVLAFTGGQVRIADGAEPVLRALAAVLNRYPGQNVVIEGHTDDIPISGTFASNWELSFARAMTVLRFLEGEGVDPIRLASAGFGKYRPRASNASAAGRAENRRVEIVVRGAR